MDSQAKTTVYPPARPGKAGRGVRFVAALAMMAALLLAPALLSPAARAQEANVQNWDHDAVTVSVHADSTFDVSERQEFVFEKGVFHGSWRDVFTTKMTDL